MTASASSRLMRPAAAALLSTSTRRVAPRARTLICEAASRKAHTSAPRPQCFLGTQAKQIKPQGHIKFSTASPDMVSVSAPALEANAHYTTDEPHYLSDLDLISPNHAISSFLVYKLEPGYDVQVVTEALRQGLETAAEQIPPLGARIHFDRGKPQRQLSPSSVKFKVRHFNHWEHKSYDELAAACFRPLDLEPGRIVPSDADDNADARPVLVAQLNFIPGGAILALSVNHIASDGWSRHLALTTICTASRAYMRGEPIPGTTVNFRRRALAAPQDLLRQSKEQIIGRIKDHCIVDPVAMAAAQAAMAKRSTKNAQNAENKTCIYKIHGDSVKRLKQVCKPMRGAEYLSTYDCVAAMLWRSLMRARTHLNQQLTNEETRMLHAVDLRNRAGTTLSRQYYGNAVKQVGTGPLHMSELLGPDGLSLAASSLRKSVQETSVKDIADATALGAMTASTEQVVFFPGRGIAGADFMLSSWYFMQTAEYDFGMGPPNAIRPGHAAIPGFAFLFPDCERRSGQRLYEIYLTLLAVEQDLLSQDEEFTSFFSISVAS